MEKIELFGHELLVKNELCTTDLERPKRGRAKLRLYIKLTDACNANCKFCANANNCDYGEIDFKKLPNKFVLKCNHGSHMNILVENKENLTKNQIKKIKRQLNAWLKTNYVFCVALETQYLGIKPCIIIEQFLNGVNDMREFKFTYFNGRLAFFWISEREVDSFRTTSTFLENTKPAPFNFDLGVDKPVDNPSIPGEYLKMRELRSAFQHSLNL